MNSESILNFVNDKKIEVFDVSHYSCPMNLVMTKQHFYNLKHDYLGLLVLDKNNSFGMQNIVNFLEFQQSQYHVITTNFQKFLNDNLFDNDSFVLILFAKKSENNKTILKEKTKAKINLKKVHLAQQLQQNIKRRKLSQKN